MISYLAPLCVALSLLTFSGCATKAAWDPGRVEIEHIRPVTARCQQTLDLLGQAKNLEDRTWLFFIGGYVCPSMM